MALLIFRAEGFLSLFFFIAHDFASSLHFSSFSFDFYFSLFSPLSFTFTSSFLHFHPFIFHTPLSSSFISSLLQLSQQLQPNSLTHPLVLRSSFLDPHRLFVNHFSPIGSLLQKRTPIDTSQHSTPHDYFFTFSPLFPFFLFFLFSFHTSVPGSSFTFLLFLPSLSPLNTPISYSPRWINTSFACIQSFSTPSALHHHYPPNWIQP
ncbi:MAG: hypothetical protein JOS17DRAFT_341247 [Linnemannia elongata]|nr:MAG: hypothetical protein JOS17DRAFT_341247 [Linnemannia elongata]